MKAWILLTGLFISVLFSSACSKGLDFLYNYPDGRHVHSEHQLKELKGNSSVDILWVVDDSSSMSAHQATVKENLTKFALGLSNNNTLDWKMGLISTTTSRLPLVGFYPGDPVDVSVPNAVQKFEAAIDLLGTGGDASEKTYEPVIQNLTLFPNFLRQDAVLALIIVTDASEQSQMKTDEFIQHIKLLKGNDLSKVLVYEFINPIDWCKATDDTWNLADSKYFELVNLLGSRGKKYPLCDVQFGSNLSKLGSEIANEVTSPKINFEDGRPVPRTITVFHDGKPVPGGKGGAWYYDRNYNALVFTDLSFAPNPNEVVTVDYIVDDGLQDE